jgi:hypothetical protein
MAFSNFSLLFVFLLYLDTQGQFFRGKVVQEAPNQSCVVDLSSASGVLCNFNHLVLTNPVFHMDAGKSASYSGRGTSITDLSNSKNNGAVTGVEFQSEKFGHFYFNGSSSITSDRNVNISGNSSRTITVWVQPNLNFPSRQSSVVRIGNGDADGWLFELIINTGDQYIQQHYWGMGTSWELVSPYQFNSGWIHIAIRYNGTRASTLVNGVILQERNFVLNTANSRVTIGVPVWSGHRSFIGNLSQVSVYDSFLSTSEIKTLYEKDRYRYL